MKTIGILTERLYSDLRNMGVSAGDIRISHSTTSFGNSSYIMVGRYKIRESDHSAGVVRTASEVRLDNDTYNEVVELLEIALFPQRFEMIKSINYGEERTITENTIKILKERGIEYKILESLGLNKRGLQSFTAIVKDQATTDFVRKN